MARLEGNDLPCGEALRKPPHRCFVQTHVEFTWVHPEQLFPAPAQALARLPVHIDNPQLRVVQKKGVRRAVDKRAEARLARAQFLLGALALRNVDRGAY